MKWKHFPRYWLFVRGIHRSPVNSPHKGQWRGALMFSLICVWINSWVNNRETGDLRRHRAHYDVIVMWPHTNMNMLYVAYICKTWRNDFLWAMELNTKHYEENTLWTPWMPWKITKTMLNFSKYICSSTGEQFVNGILYDNYRPWYFFFIQEHPQPSNLSNENKSYNPQIRIYNETEMSILCRNFHHWLQRKLSILQLPERRRTKLSPI